MGYFDEGVFGGTQGKDGSWPVASGGIVRFDKRGKEVWRFNDLKNIGTGIADCYAMGMQEDDLWASYYTDFPIVRLRDGKVRFWNSPIEGARAIAVHANRVMLAGGYGKEAARVAVLDLRGEKATQAGEFRLNCTSAAHVQGRDGVLHVVEDGRWCRICVKDWYA